MDQIIYNNCWLDSIEQKYSTYKTFEVSTTIQSILREYYNYEPVHLNKVNILSSTGYLMYFMS